MSIPEYTEVLLQAKAAKNVTFEAIGKELGRDKTWVATCFMGQASASRDEAEKIVRMLNVSAEIIPRMIECRNKGAVAQPVPIDPLIYRMYELVMVHGPAMKLVINEMFGDGIMSAIDFTMDIKKQEDPKGDRVVMTLNGKFLPYKKW